MTLNRDKLKTVLKGAFAGSFEKGGGKENRYYHGARVARYCKKIATAENLEIDDGALFLAGLFHDIGKIEAVGETGYLDYDSKGNLEHHKIENRSFKKLLGTFVDDKSLLEKAGDIIREHHNPETRLTEAQILQDADELDNFGYLQVWRTFNYAALGELSFGESLDYWKKEGRQDRRKLLENLRFESSKRVAERRFEKLDRFMHEIDMEDRGEDF